MEAFAFRLSASLKKIDVDVVPMCTGAPWSAFGDEAIGFGATSMLHEYRADLYEYERARRAAGIDYVLCPGNQVARTDGRSIWWPLTVAPFEQIALAQLTETRAEQLRWAAVGRLLAMSRKLASGVVFSSNYARNLYEATWSNNAKPIPTKVIWPSPSIEIAPRQQTQPPFLLTVSNFNRYKFALEMVEAFAVSENRRRGWTFSMVGAFPDERYQAQVLEAIETHGLHGQVELLGRKTPAELTDLYARASGFIFASVSENAASYTVIDAIATGLPTVSSFYSSTPEILGNSVAYVDPFSESSMVEGMNILVDSDQADRLARLAIEQAAKLPTWDVIAEELVEFMHRLPNGSGQ